MFGDTQTMYHVTDGANVESILNEGLLGDDRGFVFLTSSVEEAEYIGEIYDTIDDAVVFEVEVADHRLEDDPDPHGELDSHAHSGDIAPNNLTIVE